MSDVMLSGVREDCSSGSANVRLSLWFCFFFQAEDGIRDRDGWLEFRRVLFRSSRVIDACIGISKNQVKSVYCQRDYMCLCQDCECLRKHQMWYQFHTSKSSCTCYVPDQKTQSILLLYWTENEIRIQKSRTNIVGHNPLTLLLHYPTSKSYQVNTIHSRIINLIDCYIDFR